MPWHPHKLPIPKLGVWPSMVAVATAKASNTKGRGGSRNRWVCIRRGCRGSPIGCQYQRFGEPARRPPIPKTVVAAAKVAVAPVRRPIPKVDGATGS